MNKDIFKAYDIRGIYPTDLDEKSAFFIGRAIVAELDAKTLAVGRDARPHGPSLMDALVDGITSTGCNVVDLGMITTPMLYYASWNLDVDGAVAVTASHNPVEYNGVKLVGRNVKPVGETSGLNDIRDRALAESEKEDLLNAPRIGSVSEHDIITPYYEHVKQFAAFGDKKIHVVIDCANTMGVLELPILESFPDNITITKLYCDLDNAYSAHEANPLNESTLDDLRAKVLEVGADLGISYDGDADRVGFVDEKGEIIQMAITGALMVPPMLKGTKNEKVLYDLRSSMIVPDTIREHGGTPLECRVGHTFIKEQMHTESAIFATELSGHYYFQANRAGELSTVAAMLIINRIIEEQKPISEIVTTYKKYFHSGEINSSVEDKEGMMDMLKEKYSDGALDELDGIKISYWDAPHGQRWWFNVRPSNTEPVLRFICEADTLECMEEKRDEILGLIRA